MLYIYVDVCSTLLCCLALGDGQGRCVWVGQCFENRRDSVISCFTHFNYYYDFFFSISVISCSACLSVLPLPTADKDSEPLALRSVWMRGRWNSDLNSMWSLCGHAGWTESDCRLCLISESGIRELCVCVCVCRGDGVRICVFIWV